MFADFDVTMLVLHPSLAQVAQETAPFISEVKSVYDWDAVGVKNMCEGVAFQRKKPRGRLQPVLPFDRAAAIRMLHAVQDTVTDATTAHLGFMSRGRSESGGRGASWAPSAPSRLEGALLLPHDSQLRATQEADPRVDLDPHLVGSIIADVVDNMHMAAALRLLQQRLQARGAAGGCLVPPLGPPLTVKDMPQHIEQLQQLTEFAGAFGPAHLADAVMASAWVSMLQATLAHSLLKLQFVVGLVRRFMAATWHENKQETPRESHDSDLSELLGDLRSLVARQQQLQDLLLRCGAQEASAIAAVRRFAQVVHPDAHAVDAAADAVDDTFEASVAAGATVPDCDKLQELGAEPTLQSMAPDLVISGYKDFEEPQGGSAAGSVSGSEEEEEEDDDLLYIRQLLYLKEHFRQPGQPETCTEAETRARCNTGQHTVLRNLAWRPGGERGLVRAARMHGMLAKLQLLLPQADKLFKQVASFFNKHMLLIVACDFQYRCMLLHIQRSPGGMPSLQLWGRSNTLAMYSDLMASTLLLDLAWVQCFNRSVEDALADGGGEFTADAGVNAMPRDLAEGEAERRTMMLPPMLLQGGIVRPLLGAAAQLLVQGRPGADALLASDCSGAADGDDGSSSTQPPAAHGDDDGAGGSSSSVKLPGALVKLASPEQRRRLHAALPPLMEVLFSPAEAAQFLRELAQCRSRDALEQEIVSIEHTLQDMHGDGADSGSDGDGEDMHGDVPQLAPGPMATGCAGLLVQDLEAFTPAALEEAQAQVEAAVAAVCSAGLGPEVPSRIARRPELQALRQHKRHAPPNARSSLPEAKRGSIADATSHVLLLPGMLGETDAAHISHNCSQLQDGDAYSLESLEGEIHQVGPDRLMESCTGALQDWLEHQSFLMATLCGSASNWMAQQPLGAGVALRQRLSISALNRFRTASCAHLGRLTDAVAVAFKHTIALSPPAEPQGQAVSPVAGWLQRTTGLLEGCELHQSKADLIACAELMGLSPEATTQLLHSKGRCHLADRLSGSSRALRALMLQATQRTLAAMHFEALSAFLDFELVLCTQSQRLPLLTAGTRGATGSAPAHLRLAAAAGIDSDSFAASVRLQPPADSPGILTEALTASGALDAPSCLLARQAAAALRAWWAAAVPNAHASALAAEDTEPGPKAPAGKSRSGNSKPSKRAAGAGTGTGARAAATEQTAVEATADNSPHATASDGGASPTDAAAAGSPVLAGLPPAQGPADGEGGEGGALDSSWIETLLSTAAAEGAVVSAAGSTDVYGHSGGGGGGWGSGWGTSWAPSSFGVDLGGSMWMDDAPTAGAEQHALGSAPAAPMNAFHGAGSSGWAAAAAPAASALPAPPGLPPPMPEVPQEQHHTSATAGTDTLSTAHEQAVLRLFSREQLVALAKVHTQCGGDTRKLAAAAAVGAAQAVMQAAHAK